MKFIFCGKNRGSHPFFILSVIILIGVSLAGIDIFDSSALAAVGSQSGLSTSTCRPPTQPGSNSLLVVLLDRSGSLKYPSDGQPPTDPDGYSTSVTKFLVDVWPGPMYVIPFSGDTMSLPVLPSPGSPSTPNDRQELKNAVQASEDQIGGDTPLAPAMRQALGLFAGAAGGSREVIITDGLPFGAGPNAEDTATQIQEIRNGLNGAPSLIQGYCSQGIPVNAIGLNIANNDANQLLTAITRETGGDGDFGLAYQNVTSPQGLAAPIVNLYAEWLGFSLTSACVDPTAKACPGASSFPISVDAFPAKKIQIVTVRTGENDGIELDGKDHLPLDKGQYDETPPDKHYIIDTLVSGIEPGVYTLKNLAPDSQMQAYQLVISSLAVKLTRPQRAATYGLDQAIPIETEFLQRDASTGVATPIGVDSGSVIAYVMRLVHGQPAPPECQGIPEIVLTQRATNSPIFTGQVPANTYARCQGQAGDISIKVKAAFKNVTREDGPVSVYLVIPPPAPCTLGQPRCAVQATLTWAQQHVVLAGVLLAILIILIIVLWWLARPGPTGWMSPPQGVVNLLEQSKSHDLSLREVWNVHVPWYHKIWRKSSLTSNEIWRADSFNFAKFGKVHFTLIFTRRLGLRGLRRRVYIKQAKNDLVNIYIVHNTPPDPAAPGPMPVLGRATLELPKPQTLKPGKKTRLQHGDSIYIEETEVASLKLPAKWQQRRPALSKKKQRQQESEKHIKVV